MTYHRSPGEWGHDVGRAIYYGDPNRRMDGVQGLLDVYRGTLDQMGNDLGDFLSHPASSIWDGVKGISQLVYDNSMPALLLDPDARERNIQRVHSVPAYFHGLQRAADADDPHAFGQRAAPVSEAVATTGVGGLGIDTARAGLNFYRELDAASRAPIRFTNLDDFLAQANDPARNVAYEFNGHTSYG